MESGKSVLLGVTGGIAAYKAAEIIRLLVKMDIQVHVVMTRNAKEFITPLTLQVLSGNPVWTESFHLTQEQQIGHIQLVDMSDLLLIAPATANIIGKAAAGIADDLLSTILCVASRLPVVFAPSMNVNMYQNPITQENIKKLTQLGHDCIKPDEGVLACGYEGVGRLADPEQIVEHILFRLSPKDLQDERILVTAGPTEEEIDPVRFLSNPSSGKMGFALAGAAAQRGASVTLVTGPTSCRVSPLVKCIQVRSAEEMREAVLHAFPEATAILMSAAVSDYRPSERALNKIKKQGTSIRLDLEETPDILFELGERKGQKVLIGFAAETESLIKNAQDKLKRKNLDLIVANDVSRKDIGFQSDINQVKLLGKDGNILELPMLTKEVLAHKILDQIASLRDEKDGAG